MRLPAIVLRGMLDDAALVLPVLMVLVALTEVAYGLIYEWGEERLRLIPIAIAALFALEALLQPVVVRFWRARITRVERSRLWVTVAAIPIFLLEQEAIDTGWSRFAAWIAAYHVGVLLAGGAIVVTISVAAVLSQKPGLPGRLGILTLGFGAHVAVLNSFVLMTLYQVQSPVLAGALREDLDSGRVTPRLAEALAADGVLLHVGETIEVRQHHHRILRHLRAQQVRPSGNGSNGDRHFGSGPFAE